jgi:hypothetical protein
MPPPPRYTSFSITVCAGQIKETLFLRSRGASAACVNSQGITIFHPVACIEDEDATSSVKRI